MQLRCGGVRRSERQADAECSGGCGCFEQCAPTVKLHDALRDADAETIAAATVVERGDASDALEGG